jgi:iron complex outermembrane receptor protein
MVGTIHPRRARAGARHARRLARVAALAFALAATRAGAQSPLLSEEEFVADLPVVLTASRLAQPQAEAPAAVTVLDRQLIEASGARNLSELFRLVPGFLVGFESGHRQAVGYHGLTDQYSRRLQVLIDGRSVYLPSFGGVSWSDLPLALDDIERIEVIRGPNAVSYGANAFLAVINITTRHAAADPGGFARATVGSNDVRDGVLRAGGGEGNLHYRLTAAGQRDAGYHLRNDSRDLRFLNGRLDWRAGADDEIETQFGYNEGPRGRGKYGDGIDIPRDQEITSRFQQLRWRHRLASGDELSVQLYYNHHESDEQILTLPIALLGGFQIPVNYDVKSERYDAELQHTVGLGDALRLVWGAGTRLDRVEWPGFLAEPRPVDLQHRRLFGNLEWRASAALVVNAGAMLEHSDLTGADLSPRLAANYRLVPGHTLRAAVSKATRQPVLLEEQSNARFCLNAACTAYDQTYYSTGNLDPERILSGELGYLGRLAPGVTLDLRLFRDEVQRLIGNTRLVPFADFDGNALDFRNLDKAMITGSEFELRWQPERRTRLVLGYANLWIDASDIAADYSHSAPRHSLSLLALREFAADYTASAAFYYQDPMAFLDTGDTLDALRRLDLRLARRFRLAGARGEAAIVLQNLLGEQEAYYDRPSSVADQAGYFTLGVRFR